jgi:site-specific DNA recombinase
MRMAAIYARVSSEQQREEHTIASQTAALIEFAASHDLQVPQEWVFEDEGYSGATLERPGLERVEISPPKVRSKRFSPTRPIG